jgi:hypothetical protein
MPAFHQVAAQNFDQNRVIHVRCLSGLPRSGPTPV